MGTPHTGNLHGVLAAVMNDEQKLQLALQLSTCNDALLDTGGRITGCLYCWFIGFVI